MPHLILEVPKGFDNTKSQDIIITSQDILINRLPTKLESFKSRIYSYDSAIVAGGDADMVHLSIKVLKGREAELLKSIIFQIKDVMQNIIQDESVSITAELSELSDMYAK